MGPAPLNATHNICAQVDEQEGNGANWQGQPNNDVNQKGAELRKVLGQGVSDGLLQVVKYQAT